MNSDEFARLEKIVLHAAGLPEDARKAYLDEACTSPEMRVKAEAMLAADPGDVDSLAEGATTLDPTTDASPTEVENEQIGPYRLIEKIGEGGMGSVYLAEQLEPVRRRVALKVIKRGMDTKQVIARFEAERQALALMDHPNIAKVFDAGSTPRGRPYFVMEYVKGIPVTTYCDKHRLTNRQRLELFMQVCDGVQHAHQKAIIHRDLKPSNVLVMIQDDKPVPKIIDFGVAKATTQKLTEKTVYTALGELIGTPEYMSPEQAEMTSEDVDTRTDVYSLGVVLYQLLAGGLPFEPEELRHAGFQGIMQMIREKDPPRPSTKVSTLGERTTDIAASRRTLPGKLSSQLRGDLDWITMRALEKDRTRRYGSAAEFASDLSRHLHHEPVLAGPPDAGYRVRKFVRRHRGGVVAASVVAASLLVATVVSVRFALSEAEQRRLVAEQQQVAATERDIARAVNDFLNNDLLAAVAPSAEKGKGKDVLMRDVLDEAGKRIDEAEADGGKFEDKPLVEASIRQTLGVTYEALGEYAVAEPHLKRAHDLRRRELSEEHARTLISMNSLANVYLRLARFDEAESLYLRAIETQKRALGDEHPATLALVANVAHVYLEQGRHDEAEELYLRTLELQTRVLGEDHVQTLRTMYSLAMLYREHMARLDEAEPLYRRVIEIQTRVLGEKHLETVNSALGLAYLYQQQGRFDEAEPILRNAIDVRERVLGEEHPQTLTSMGNLALLYLQQKLYASAESLLLRTIEIQTHAEGADHPNTLHSLSTLAEVCRRQGRYEEARDIFTQVLPPSRLIWPGGGWFVGLLLGNYGATLIELERYEDAESALSEGHQHLSASLGSNHELTVEVIGSLAKLYLAWGKPERASEWQSKLSSDDETDASDEPRANTTKSDRDQE